MSSRDFNGPYQPGGGSHRSAGGRGRQEYSGWGDDGFWEQPDTSRGRGARATGAAGVEAARMGAARLGDAIKNSSALRSVGSLRNAAAGRMRGGRGTARRAGRVGNVFREGGYSSGGYSGGGYYRDGHQAGRHGQTTVAPGRPGAGRGAPGGPWGPAGPGPGGPGPGGPGRGGPGRGGRRAAPGRPGYNGRGPYGRGKLKGSWWRVWTIRKALGVSAAAIGLFSVIGILGVLYVYGKTPVPTQELQADLFQRSTVYYSDGKTVIGTFGNYNRQPLNYNQIPQTVQDAVVAAEDRGFWTEGGISPRGIARAAYDDIFHSSDSLQGGSTITQQFVRNFYEGIGTAQTTSRKIKEIFVSMKIARSRSKQWILTNYLNTIYLGDGSYGIGAAAQTYFGVPVSKLTVAQAAVIAAIIQQPTNYPLPQFRPQLEARWHYVLNGMVQMGDLSAQQAATMKFPDMNPAAGEVHVGSDPWDPYVLEQVKNELQDFYDLSDQQIDNGGLRIVTTINRSLTSQLYQAVDQNVELMKEDGGALPSYALIGAELQDPQTGAILAEYPGRGQNMSKAECAKFFCDNNTVLSREQVGSSFKPYVLAEAVKEGMDVQGTTLDGGFAPTMYIPPDSPESNAMTLSTPDKNRSQSDWAPISNDGMSVYGPMTVQNAFAQSSNVAFTDLIHRVGTQAVVNFAASVGVNTQASDLQGTVGEVGMALGIDAIRVNEQDTMLSALANGGTYHEGHVIASLTYAGAVHPAQYTTRTVLTQQQDSEVQYAMQTVTTDGTGTQAAMSDGRPIIAKTGTTSSFRSGFFIGAIPQAALTVGIFTADQGDKICNSQGKDCVKNPETLEFLGGTTGQTGFGGYWPARIWHTFMDSAYLNSPVEQFLPPQFSGTAWNQVGNLAKKPAKHRGGLNGLPIGLPGGNVGFPGGGNGGVTGGNGGLPGGGNGGGPISGLPVNGGGAGGGLNVTQPGVAAGGALGVLPEILLWSVVRRRRGRRKTAASGSGGRFPS